MDSHCIICQDDTVREVKELECGHSFHASCLVDWFRNNPSCPMCRAQPGISGMTLHARCKYLCALARRKTGPPELKKLVARLKKKRETLSAKVAELRDFKTANAAILREERKLTTSRYRAMRDVREFERVIGSYHSTEHPLPPLVSRQNFWD